MRILVTGAAGFIGYHLTKRLLQEGCEVIGIDNLNDYYDPQLKYDRLCDLGVSVSGMTPLGSECKASNPDSFTFLKIDLSDRLMMEGLFNSFTFDAVVNLAAQAGVRYSIENPHAYTSSNIEGFLNILEGCRKQSVKHLIYASSSSVYGANDKMPFSIQDQVDHPVSLYAATKKANELMAHTYSHLYNIPVTGLRFFTVYGPWGRPDMAYFKFADLMRAGKSIDVYNNGKMARDFTYIDDIVESIYRLIPFAPGGNDPSQGTMAPYHCYNIGNGSPVNLLDFIKVLEEKTGMKAIQNMMPIQPGDVEKTWADSDALYQAIDYRPAVTVDEGLESFAKWYSSYYKITGSNEKVAKSIA